MIYEQTPGTKSIKNKIKSTGDEMLGLPNERIKGTQTLTKQGAWTER